MDVWIVENGELVLYKRSGQCNQCGKCCRTHTITFISEISSISQEHGSDEVKEDDWSDHEGWSIFEAQGIWWYFKILEIKPKEDSDSTCPRLTESNECTEWQTENFRPICRYWPFHPSNIEYFPGCGFSFERKEE